MNAFTKIKSYTFCVGMAQVTVKAYTEASALIKARQLIKF